MCVDRGYFSILTLLRMPRKSALLMLLSNGYAKKTTSSPSHTHIHTYVLRACVVHVFMFLSECGILVSGQPGDRMAVINCHTMYVCVLESSRSDNVVLILVGGN